MSEQELPQELLNGLNSSYLPQMGRCTLKIGEITCQIFPNKFSGGIIVYWGNKVFDFLWQENKGKNGGGWVMK